MGQRGEVFSTRVMKADVTYFFNVKENIYGEMFLNIAMSRKGDGRFIRQSIVVYQERLEQFMQALNKEVDLVKKNAPTGKPLDYVPYAVAHPKKPARKGEPEEPVVGRVYTFVTKKDDWGDYSISITEKKSSLDMSSTISQAIQVYQEDLGEFVRRLQEAVDYIHIHQPAEVKAKHFVVRKKPAVVMAQKSEEES